MSEAVKKKLEENWNESAKHLAQAREQFRKAEDLVIKAKIQFTKAKDAYIRHVEHSQGLHSDRDCDDE